MNAKKRYGFLKYACVWLSNKSGVLLGPPDDCGTTSKNAELYTLSLVERNLNETFCGICAEPCRSE